MIMRRMESKLPKRHIIIFLFILAVTFWLPGDYVFGIEIELPQRIEGVGTYFEIQDSEYLDIILGSAEEIKVVLESIPRMISLDIEATDENVNTAELIVEGLEPNKTYYKYQNSYKNEAVFISSENGSYNWVQDLSQSHHIWIQEIKGTTFISEDTVLDYDITGSVEIIANNIILDCNGYSITGSDTGYGIYLNSRENVTIKNCVIKDFSYGIDLYGRSTNNKIIGNNILDNYYGIFIECSPENYFRDNSMANNNNNFGIRDGIWALGVSQFIQDIDISNTVNGKPIYYLVNEQDKVIDSAINAGFVGVVNSKNITMRDLTIEKNIQGVLFAYTTDSTIENVTASNNQYGLFLYSSSNNNITKNNISNNKRGIALDHYSLNNNIINNNASDNSWVGILLGGSSNNNIISENNVLNNGKGIILSCGWCWTSNNTITANNVSNNFDSGIVLGSSTNNNITANNVSNNGFKGIYLSSDSSNNNITENNVLSNGYSGIYILGSDTYTHGWGDHSSKNNKIIGNNISDNDYGIYLKSYAPENYFRDNSLEGNKYSFKIDGWGYGHYNSKHYIQDIDTSNTVNGKPIYYLVNEQNKVIDKNSNAGFVGVINSKNIAVKNVTLKNNYEGVLFFNTANSIIEGVNVSNNENGIGLYLSTDIDIIGSNTSGNNRGIYLSYSSHNNITGNIILNNTQYGIHLNGVWNARSTNNNIYHNNFIDNSRQVKLHYATNNLFNAGYPSGGNYWSDYTGIDLYNGSDQDQFGSDGIGDFPYVFTGGQDAYPFMEESGWEEIPDLVFQPDLDGFGFKNFKTTRSQEMFIQFFGEDAVLLSDGKWRKAAEQFFKEHYHKKMGSCDGFSGASLINFEQLDQPHAGPFTMPFYDSLYDQDLNSDIEEAIAYQQGSWYSLEIQSYISELEKESNNSPKFFYQKIKEAIQNKTPIVLWIWEKSKWWRKGDGHALVPYKYEEESSGNKAYVYVYDSNYPGDDNQKIIFDLEDNKWSYKVWKGWWIFRETWEGDSSYRSMITVPLYLRLHEGRASWDQKVSPYAYVCSDEGPVSLLFIDQDANRLGFIDGQFVSEISGATYFVPPTQNQDEVLGLYYLPEDDYTIIINGIDEGTMDFSVFSNQLLIQITDATIHSSTIDNLNIGKGNSSLTYTTNDDYKEYSATIAEEFPDASRIVTVDTNISVGDITTLEVIDEQIFKYMNLGSTKTYNLLFEQRGTGSGQISFSDLIIRANDTHIVEVIDWNDLENTAINAKIDEDNDGTIDKIERLQVIPRRLKEEVKTNLEAAKTGHKLIDKEIDLIVENINRSLDGKLWVDDFHLDPKSGKKVFHEEHIAVVYMHHRIELFEKKIKTLEKLIEKKQKRGLNITKEESELKAIKSILPVFKQAVYDLTKTDEKLAEVVINDAKNALVKNPKFQKIVDQQIKKAKKELSRAKEELAEGRAARAITKFDKAWTYAQLAIKFAKLNN